MNRLTQKLKSAFIPLALAGAVIFSSAKSISDENVRIENGDQQAIFSRMNELSRDAYDVYNKYKSMDEDDARASWALRLQMSRLLQKSEAFSEAAGQHMPDTVQASKFEFLIDELAQTRERLYGGYDKQETHEKTYDWEHGENFDYVDDPMDERYEHARPYQDLRL